MMQKLFQDPTWWMTAVFVALVVSIVANFITHALLKTLARFSPRIRRWRERRRETLLRDAEDLARDVGLVLFHYLSGILFLILWSTTVTFMTGVLIMLRLSEGQPSSFSRILILAVFVVTMIMSVMCQARAISVLRLAMTARQIYKKTISPDQRFGGNPRS